MKTLVSIFMAILMATLIAILKAMVLMIMTHIRRLVTLNPVIQYPRKDILAPSSSTENKKTKVPPDVDNGDYDENDVNDSYGHVSRRKKLTHAGKESSLSTLALDQVQAKLSVTASKQVSSEN